MSSPKPQETGSSDPSATSPGSLALTSQDFEAYQYTHLKEELHEIRLLTLLPGTFSSDIRLCLDITPLTADHVPDFEAISYTWGSACDPVNIFVGKISRKTLPVTQNLAEALQYFRYQDKPRTLWIDAICVDQQNLKERSQQVKRMVDIYSKAVRVVVWLGPESDDSSLAMDCFDKIASKVKVDWTTLSMSAITHEVHWGDITTRSPLEQHEMLSINHLIYRSWFERLWIWQEVILASEHTQVMCGTRTTLWNSLCATIFLLYVKKRPWFSEALQFIPRIQQVFNLCAGRKGLRIEDLIHQSRNCICTDPRDKIYALVSLLHKREGIRIEPDYTKNAYEVYQDAVSSIIESSRLLRVLSNVELHEDLERVPSWVPNLMVARPCNLLAPCYASSSSIHTLQIDTLGKVLKVEGIAAAVIEQVEPFLVCNPSMNDTIAELKRIARRMGLQGAAVQSRQFKAFARAALANRYAERYYPPRDGVPTAAQSEMVLHDILEPETINDNAGFRASTLNAFSHNCPGRSLFLTKDGVPGLGPLAAKEGDIVTVLLGSLSAMILRPTQEGNYKLVGEAYCDGFMHGEALLGPLPDSFNAVFRHDPTNDTFRWAYLDQETGVCQAEDPRLGPLPDGWSIKSHKDEEFAQLFVNNQTGVTRVETWDDPRLSWEALEKRGVPLQVFDLV